MEELLVQAANVVSRGLEAMALFVIAFGAVEAAIGIFRVLLPWRRTTGTEKRAVWLEFSRWLIAGLTFQLAADIVQTMVATSRASASATRCGGRRMQSTQLTHEDEGVLNA